MAWPDDSLPPDGYDIRQATPQDYGPIGMPDSGGMGGEALMPPPQFQDPSGFWPEIVRSAGAHPFNFQPRRSGQGIDVLLALLQGFGNAKAQRAATEMSDVEKKNARLRESASNLAKQRWERQKAEQARLATKANIVLSGQLRSQTQKPEQSLEDKEKEAERLAAARTRGTVSAGGGTLFEVMGPDGKIIRTTNPNARGAPVPGEKPKPPSAAEREQLVDDATLLKMADETESALKPNYVGPGHGILGKGVEMAGAMSSEESSFRAGLAGIRNRIYKMRSGQAVTAGEAQRLLDELPNLEDPPTAFRSKMKKFRQVARDIAEQRRQTMSETGLDLSRLSPLKGGESQAVRFTYDKNGKRIQ